MINKLNRFKNQIVRTEDRTNRMDMYKKNTKIDELSYHKDWLEAGVKPYYVDDEYCMIREVVYPLHHQHGLYSFGDFFQALDTWNTFPHSHPLSSKGLAPSDLFFFDIETTGLGSGAGNTIFLIGYAQFTEKEVIVRQHFLPEPGLEVPLYDSFLRSVNYSTLVTYNGKSFDWPQVQTRHTFVRNHVPKLPAVGHFDLLHASRRLWKHTLDSVKLARVEEEMLGVIRTDDIPGHLAPMIYFDYVERKDPAGILKVMQHNETDILSLITLYIHLTNQIHGLDRTQSPSIKANVGKWFMDLGEQQAAKEALQAAVKGNEAEAFHYLAYQYKREKKYDEAMRLWEKTVKKGSKSIKKEALIELAKLHEHQFKNFPEALKLTDKAIHLNDTVYSRRFAQDAYKRKLRLKGKLSECPISRASATFD